MAKAKQTAFVIDEKREDEIASSDAQTFGALPGIWVKGVPVLLAEIDPALDEAEFKRMVKDAGAPIVAVKLDADYRHKAGHSQNEIRQKGGVPHLPSGGPLTLGGEATAEPYEDLSKSELERVAEARQVEDTPERSKKELVEGVVEQDEGKK